LSTQTSGAEQPEAQEGLHTPAEQTSEPEQVIPAHEISTQVLFEQTPASQLLPLQAIGKHLPLAQAS
jgi:hypothetical protein